MQLTKAEEQVMQILWDLGEGLVKDILDKFEEPKPARNTVSTVVRILEKKGFVGHKDYGKVFVYYPLVLKKEYSGKASGWLIDLRKSEKVLGDGKKYIVLEGKPDWTPDAQAAIKKGEYKGYSIEFDDWKNPETGKLYKDVLFGGAVTNRPYVKNMPAITLSEEIDTEIPLKEEKRMKEIKKILAEIGLPVDGTDEYVDEKVAEHIKTLSEKASTNEKKLTDALKERDEAKKALTDIQPKIDRLAELEKSEDARSLAEVMTAAKGKISPADEKDEKHWFNKKLKEKKYAEILEILSSIKTFKDKTDGKDDGESGLCHARYG